MFGSQLNGANAYSKVGMETGVVAASPHKLIIMLFEGALLSISSAVQHMEAGNMEAKGKSISRAVAIIGEGLRASLDKKMGGDIALSLDALYEYMISTLMTANLKNQQNMLEEVSQLLKGLKDAWEAIDPSKTAGAQQPEEVVLEPQPTTPLVPQTSRLVKAYSNG